MIISMRPHAPKAEIDYVCERIREFGYKVHSIEGEERVVIGVVGVGDVTACLESLEASPGVERAVVYHAAPQEGPPRHAAHGQADVLFLVDQPPPISGATSRQGVMFVRRARTANEQEPIRPHRRAGTL